MKVRLTAAALQDLDKIYRDLAAYSVRYAERVENAVFDTLDIFGRHPQFGVPTDEKDVHRWPIHEFGYSVFYRVNRKENVIEVLRAMDGRRVRDLKRVPRSR